MQQQRGFRVNIAVVEFNWTFSSWFAIFKFNLLFCNTYHQQLTIKRGKLFVLRPSFIHVWNFTTYKSCNNLNRPSATPQLSNSGGGGGGGGDRDASLLATGPVAGPRLLSIYVYLLPWQVLFPINLRISGAPPGKVGVEQAAATTMTMDWRRNNNTLYSTGALAGGIAAAYYNSVHPCSLIATLKPTNNSSRARNSP